MGKKKQSLDIRNEKHLALRLGFSLGRIREIAQDPKSFYREFSIVTGNGKRRSIASPTGDLRTIQRRVNDILQNLVMPSCVYGGRRGFSHFDNARVHCRQPMLLKSDLQDFFPSINHRRVYKTFIRRLGCSPDVARLLTKLTTVNGCIPTGGPSSTILATFVAEKLFLRLENLAKGHGARFSVFVDDITLSGPTHLSNLRSLAVKIIQSEGFQASMNKTIALSASDVQTVTGLRVNNGLDVDPKKLFEVRSLLDTLESDIGENGSVSRSRLSRIEGKIDYISRCNIGAGKVLRKRLRRLGTLYPLRFHA